jgi:demethylmenaquinone methyltransferase/2-methoxy-6-polyprenyl-1,4-benzoquinol methylase
MCTGTGETVANLARYASPGTQVYGVDLSVPMMRAARAKPGCGGVAFVSADVGQLPFPDESLDLITMSFATRNINRSPEILSRNFQEYHRVLKRRGRFVSVETSRPPWGVVRSAMDLYVRLFVRQVGARVSGSRVAYAYLSNTIPRFHGAETLAGIMREAGFGDVTYQRLLMGVAAIHVARKTG